MSCRRVVYFLPSDERPYVMNIFAVTFEQLKEELRRDRRIQHQFSLAAKQHDGWMIEYLFEDGVLPAPENGQEVYQVVAAPAPAKDATQPRVYIVPGPFGLDLHLRHK